MGISTTAATGSRGAIHIGQEVTYGVVAEPTHLIEFTSESLSAEEESLMSEAIRESRGRHHVIRGTLDIQGDINFEQNASGLAILYKNALGDYLKLQGVDGGVHARVERDGEVAIVLPSDILSGGDQVVHYLIPFTTDHTGGFTLEAGRKTFTVVGRNNIENLVEYAGDPNPHSYDDYAHGGDTYIVDNATVAAVLTGENAVQASGGYTGQVTESAVRIALAYVRDEGGNLVPPDLCPSGGVIKVGNLRKELHYFEYDDRAGDPGAFAFVYVSPVGFNGLNPAQPLTWPSAGDYVMAHAAIVKKGSLTALDVRVNNFQDAQNIAKVGNWVYQYNGDPALFTHHIERGKRLPVGMTIEVDRDAAIFVYTGVRVNTLSCSFESGEIATGTFGLLGKAEYAMATLMGDVLPDSKTIHVDKVQAFPKSLYNNLQSVTEEDFTPGQDLGVLTIREETDIYYQWIKDHPAGGYVIGGIPTSADAGYEKNAVEQFHPRRSNVDSRTSIKAANVVRGLDTPLSSFEIAVYMNGYFEEVLSASLSLNNNLDTDKFFLGDRFRAFAVEGRTEIDGTLGMEFDDGKHYVKFLNGEYFTLEIKCINEDDESLIGNFQVPSQAYFFLPRCKFSGDTPNIDGPEIINHDMPFMATVDDKYRTTDLVVILVNAEGQDAEMN